jgi:hypothetical protein
MHAGYFGNHLDNCAAINMLPALLALAVAGVSDRRGPIFIPEIF